MAYGKWGDTTYRSKLFQVFTEKGIFGEEALTLVKDMKDHTPEEKEEMAKAILERLTTQE